MRKTVFLFFLTLFISFGSLCQAETVPAFTETFEGSLLTTLPWSQTGTLEKNKGYETIFSVFCYMDTVLHLTNGDSANPAEMEALQKVLETAVGKSYINTGNMENAMLAVFTDTVESIIIRYAPAEKQIRYERVPGVPDIGAWEDKLQITSQEFIYALNELTQPLENLSQNP